MRKVFRINALEVDCWTLELTGPDGVRHKLEPKIIDVLHYLALHQGELVSKDELLQQVWPDVVVSDDTLHQIISKIRRLTSERFPGLIQIETVKKRGYRLVSSVDWNNHEPTPEPMAPTLPVPQPHKQPSRLFPTRFRWWILGLPCLLGLTIWGIAIYRERPTPGQTEVITAVSLPGEELWADASSDGTRLVFAKDGYGARRPVGKSLYVASFPGGVPTPVTQPAPGSKDLFPVWSPDDRFVYFIRILSENAAVLCRMPAGRWPDVQQLYHLSSPHLIGLDIHPDGKKAVYAYRASPTQPYRIYSLTLDTFVEEQLSTPPAGIIGDMSPRFSPDGTRISFKQQVTAGNERLYTLELTNRQVRPLTQPYPKISGFCWHPNGNRVLFGASLTGKSNLWSLDAPLASPTLVLSTGTNLFNPIVAGSWIVFEQYEADRNLRRVSLDRPLEVRLLFPQQPGRQYTKGRFLNGGRKVVYVSDQNDRPEVWIWSTTDDSPPRRLTGFRDETIRHLTLSPDEQWALIAVQSLRPGKVDSRFVRVHLVSGAVDTLYADQQLNAHPAIHPSGRYLVYSTLRNGRWELFRLPLDKTAPPETLGIEGYVSQFSPDGTYLLFTRKGQPGLWRVSVGRWSAVTPICPDLSPLDEAGWVPTPNGLVRIRRSGGHSQLVLETSSPHRQQVLLDTVIYESGDGLSYDKTTRQVLLTVPMNPQSDLKAIGLPN
ncbi:winged helix-turn-helix domain-containing protein [Larkinella sp. VNQ87]|uniref:winged helix-turn-helix domain-containing protein n=1 Tax=Larkinella sp. VNQ87 TaxID=3400921 RepID=UPI003BFC245D